MRAQEALSANLDPAFQRIPFEQWLAEPDRAIFHWTVRVPRAGLSFHQRLATQVELTLDGRDLENRRTHGKLVFFVQITDKEGRRYQDHNSIELARVDENIGSANVQLMQSAFFLPGDYRLAVAILDTDTGEHAAKQASFQIASVHQDFLLSAWRNLPTVEFIGNHESPDSWFLPEIVGRLQWTAAVHSSAAVNILLNVAAPSESGSRTTPSGGLPALIPAFKILAQPQPAVSTSVELIDLSRHRMVFHEQNLTTLDWPAVKTSLKEANTASIDVHSLSERHRDARFFVAQVRKILSAPKPPTVLVVLATALAFESGEDLTPISLEDLPPCRIIYIRYRAYTPAMTSPFPQPRRRGSARMGGPGLDTGRGLPVPDRLASTLKPLNPKIFDVDSPEQLTKALSEVEKALSSSGN